MGPKAVISDRLALGAAFGVFALQLLLTLMFQPPTAADASFFYEYGNIAESIVAGKGYSNVFRAESGPTAWMTPGFVYVIAFIYWVFGVKTTAAAWVCMLLNFALMALTLYLLLRLLTMSTYRQYRYLITGLFAMGMVVFQHMLLFDMMDYALMIALTVLTLYGLVVFFRGGTRGWLFLLAVLLPLFNPALTLAFAVTLFGISLLKIVSLGSPWTRQFYGQKAVKRTLATLGTVAVGFVISTGWWTYHNYQAFGRLIPSKSNLWYEFYQSNVLDSDGVLSQSTMQLYHPATNPEEQKHYAKLGEYQYVLQYKHKSQAFLTEHAAHFAQKIGNRLVWAFLWSKSSADDMMSYNPPLVGFTPTDSLKLLRSRLIHQNATSTSSNRWQCFNLEEAEFVASVKGLQLERETALIEDWKYSKQYLERMDTRPRGLVKGVMLSLIPTLCILLGLLISRIRRDVIFATAAMLCLVYTVPYVLIAYYFRYQVVLMGLQAVLVFYLVAYLLTRIQTILLGLAASRQKEFWPMGRFPPVNQATNTPQSR